MFLRLALAAALSIAAQAHAHSQKEIVSPAENATVNGSPPAIRMEFDSAMRITQISLTDTTGKAYALSRTDRMRPVTDFSAAPQRLPPGSYTVKWRGISLDGHTMEGSWSFAVK